MTDPPDMFIVHTERGDFLTFLDPLARKGDLPGAAIIGQLLSEPVDPKRGQHPELSPDRFMVNLLFVDFLHSVIARHAPVEPDFVAQAERQQNGRIYVIDGRTPDPQHAPGEDVLGQFEIRDGQLLPDSYESYPGHQIFTRYGVVRLTPFVHQRLVLELEHLHH